MWEKLNTTERFFTIVVIMGSVVDVFQFSWLIKKTWQGARAKLYKKVRREILLDLHEKKQKDDSPPPFVGFKEDK